MNGTLKYLEDHKIKDPICQKIQGRISEITSADNEETTLRSVAVALTLASYSTTPKRKKEVLVFVENTASRLQLDVGVPDSGPHLVGFFASRETARRLVAGDETTEMNKGESIDIPLSPRLICAAVFQQLHEQDEDENVKLSRNGLDDAGGGSSSIQKCQLYLLCLSRLRPASCLQYGLIITINGFTLLSVGLSKWTVWEEVSWKSGTCVPKLCTCVKLIQDEALRPVHPASPKLVTVLSVDARTVGIYSAVIGGKQYRLLPIFAGRGDDRKPFVALAAAEDNEEDIRVFKYSWHGKTRECRERDIFDKLGGVPGVVHIDRQLSTDCLETDEMSGKSRSLLVLTTVAYPLGACGTVLKFLEAMYDLLEVLRYLAQEKKILHRDVSWANVLITPVDQGEEIGKGFGDLGAQNDKDGEGVPHGYRFVSDIFKERRRRVRVALADFDHAHDLSGGNMNDLKDAAGTLMFMANDVLLPRGEDHMGSANPASFVRTTTTKSALEDCEGKYADESEKAAWDDFYKNVFKRLDWVMTNESFEDVEIKQSFQHGAVHDAESVFYICILFFSRVWPLDEKIKATERRALEIRRGKLFEMLLTKFPDSNVELRSILGALRDEQCPRLLPFFTMLRAIGDYLMVPWYNVVSTRRGERYEFHLHDFMQRLFLKEINRMRGKGDHVKLAGKPLSVRTCVHLSLDSCSEVPDLQKDPASEESASATGHISCAAQVVRVRGDSSSKECNGVTIPPDCQESILTNTGETIFFPERFWEIYRWKIQEKLWFSSDKLYR